MGTYLLTGCAGFIGSHLLERLLSEGHHVIGVDSFTPHYDLERKKSHLRQALQHPRFRFVEADLSKLDIRSLLPVDAVFHLAAQAGVRSSWGSDFSTYVHHNLEATQHLLEGLITRPPAKIIFASTSSVYGNVPLPMREDGPTRPLSPYGVTKLACERLLYAYSQAFGISVTVLRYFTVYGPRQRPDMGIYQFIRALHRGETLRIYGDGLQQRDFTYVGDVVEATVRALHVPGDFEVINVGGGSQVTVLRLAEQIAELLHCTLQLDYLPYQKGDPHATLADTRRARKILKFVPRTPLEFGLRQQIDWQLASQNG